MGDLTVYEQFLSEGDTGCNGNLGGIVVYGIFTNYDSNGRDATWGAAVSGA